jgi:hypothetical protein
MAREFGMAVALWDTLGGGRLKSKKQVSSILLVLNVSTLARVAC